MVVITQSLPQTPAQKSTDSSAYHEIELRKKGLNWEALRQIVSVL